jgi:hypothetical protein
MPPRKASREVARAREPLLSRGHEPVQHIAYFAIQLGHGWIFSLVAQCRLLAHLTTPGWRRRSICYLAPVQSFVTFLLAHVPDAAVNESGQSKLQPDVTKLLANFAHLASALLTDVACTVQLAHVSQLFSCESQLQSGFAQPSRSCWCYLSFILSSLSVVVSNISRGLLAHESKLPKKPRKPAEPDEPQLLANVACFFSPDPWSG